ncbi:porin family protein [Halorhodospira halophila]|uniref:Outer membrane protein beta-barrel domain-containing protein n=1 Tax=Halorhodospira halophila (strain DSM 244 / SL1) TaxID=349124 RepID=A1WWI9_HALHL|nr:porin family protein [Halorhodospira halophila]ABM62051.1 conserved hypothetical protein [Halorhodospira halophila SL1]MBK1730179.1 porin family protein [Halorhodospira halophila]
MDRTRTVTLVGISALCLSGAVMAQAPTAGDSYAGGQIASATYGEDDVPQLGITVDGDADLTGLVGRVGTYVSEYVSVEGRAGFGIGDDSVTVSEGATSVDVDVELDYLFGGYVRGHLPVGDALALYGIVGLTGGQMTAEANGFSYSQSDTGASFGAGVDIHVGDAASANFEYMQYLDEAGYEIDALSAGLVGRF